VRRALAIALVVAAAGTAQAGKGKTPSVDAELRRLADRAAQWGSPPGLWPLAEEHLAAGSLEGFDSAMLTRMRRTRSANDDAWLALGYGALGDREEVDRLAERTSAELTTSADDPMNGSTRCGFAMAYEYLGDEAEADWWRKAAAGYDWCHEHLPLAAARSGHHERALDLLAEENNDYGRVSMRISLAEVYAAAGDKKRATRLLDEAETIIAEGDAAIVVPVAQWPRLAVQWAAAGDKKRAKAAAKKGLETLAVDAAGEPALLLISGPDVAAGLLAAGDKKAVTKLLAKLEAARADDTRYVARLQTARVVAMFGTKKRARPLVDAVAKDLADGNDEGAGIAARFALIDAYLALGDLPAAIEQASLTSMTNPMEVEAVLEVARHCRVKKCKRTRAITKALQAVSERLDRIEEMRR
jgi:hypothetical protein